MFQLKEIFKLDKNLKLAHHLCASYKRHIRSLGAERLRIKNGKWQTMQVSARRNRVWEDWFSSQVTAPHPKLFSSKGSTSGLPWWLSGKESACQCGRHGFDPWSRKIPHCMGQLPQAPQLLSLCSRAHALQQEKPLQWDAHAP